MEPIPHSSHNSKARYIMVGGFLGAGKTTSILKLARHLTRKGLRVGLITNDQGTNLVDTAMLRSQGFVTEEIPGGCFCCRFNSLVDAAQRLTADARPDVFIAEPVGSCTDLAATVTYPLRRMYGDQFTVAPVSVLVDPIRALRVLKVEPGGNFSEKVLYIYRKQLEEADLIVINKIDLFSPNRLESLLHALERNWPGKRILPVSARAEENLQAWFDAIATGEQSSAKAMGMDYTTYAEGEALLGWLNCTVELQGNLDADQFLRSLAASIQKQLGARNMEVAHLKMTLSPHGSLAGEIAAINLVRGDFVPELSFQLDGPVSGGQLLVNLRAEADPDRLASVVLESLSLIQEQFPGALARVDHMEHFRPGKPVPTYRLEQMGEATDAL